MRPFLILSAAVALMWSSATAAQQAELLHSDLPLWRPGDAGVSPRAFTNPETFGCAHRLKLGIWRFDARGEDEGDPIWYRLTNYGMMHCWMNVAEGSDHDTFGSSRPAFLVELGSAGGRELWALQLGARPGSEYLLLARSPAEGPIGQFDVLQRDCTRRQLRQGEPLDILITRYCGINSKHELVAMARRMAKLPPLGRMRFHGLPPDSDDDE
ncbi:hypothetical protein [Phenylobacterium sp.]|uniref:hypothetical protein n=1 Tax=Phenylobacterium sp. TaxID=1871053 RepID=UPI00301E0327